MKDTTRPSRSSGNDLEIKMQNLGIIGKSTLRNLTPSEIVDYNRIMAPFQNPGYNEQDIVAMMDYCQAHNYAVPTLLEESPLGFGYISNIFTCQRCGSCCLEYGGFIILKPGDEIPLASALRISPRQFKKRYTSTYLGNRFMRQPCPLHSPEGCLAYEGRPQICRLFPLQHSIRVITEGREVKVLALSPKCKAARQVLMTIYLNRRKRMMSMALSRG